MNRRLNAVALAVIFGGGGMLVRPGSASATYIDPWGGYGGGGDGGITYCCVTGSTHCCYMTGCATKEGVCVRAVPAS